MKSAKLKDGSKLPAYQLDATYQKMRACSDAHLAKIILSGKSYGPVDQDELFEFAQNLKIVNRNRNGGFAQPSPRELALRQGRWVYDGNRCKVCGSTRRYTSDYKCVACDPEGDIERRKFRVSGGPSSVITRISKNHDLNVADVIGHSRYPRLVRCRHEIWAALASLDVKVSTIARMFSCDHSSVRYGIEQHKKPTKHNVSWNDGGAVK